MADAATVRHSYRQFAEMECRGYSDLYYRLALGAADDESIVRFIADRPIIQPNLFFAAVQFVVGVDDVPSNGPQLAMLLRTRGVEVADVMDRRGTQTNEVGRCAVLVPALPPGPLALLEVGASAGLCLLLDQFFYDYGAIRVGDASSPVRLVCSVDGAGRLPLTVPHVVWRRGLDIRPIDVRDDDEVRWLLACVWADHPHRRQRLAAAIDLARANPPLVVRGDLVDDLEAVAREAPHEARLVVFHSAVFPYVEPSRRLRFAEVLADISQERELVWISNEAPGVVSRLGPTSPPGAELRYVVGRTTFGRGAPVDEVLGVAHPHGRELSWLHPPVLPSATLQ